MKILKLLVPALVAFLPAAAPAADPPLPAGVTKVTTVEGITEYNLANGLRAARHMRNLARDYGEGRFESACAYAWPLNITALRSMNSILANQADLRPPRPAPTQPRPLHPNVRGAQYFGE